MNKTAIVLIVIVLSVVAFIMYAKNQKSMSPSLYPNSATANKSVLTLQILQPTDKVTVKESSLLVKGTTLPKASVFVNDNDVQADSEGNFSTTVILEEGENPVVVTAVDDDGNSVEKELAVTLDTGIL